MIFLYEADLNENYRFGESQVFCLWRTMTTLQAAPPTEQLVMQLGLAPPMVGGYAGNLIHGQLHLDFAWDG